MNAIDVGRSSKIQNDIMATLEMTTAQYTVKLNMYHIKFSVLAEATLPGSRGEISITIFCADVALLKRENEISLGNDMRIINRTTSAIADYRKSVRIQQMGDVPLTHKIKHGTALYVTKTQKYTCVWGGGDNAHKLKTYQE